MGSATEKREYLQTCLNEAKEHYEANKDKDIEYLITKDRPLQVKINNKEFTIPYRGERRPKTHKEYYETKYNDFINNVDSFFNSLYSQSEFEKEIKECEQKTTVKEKYFCLSRLKVVYEKYANDYEYSIKTNPTNEIVKKSYAEYKYFIGKISELQSNLKTQPQTTQKPKSKKKTSPPKNGYSLVCNYSEKKIKSDLLPAFQNLFYCEAEQIVNLLSEKITAQIRAKKDTAIKDVLLLFDKLSEANVIQARQTANVLAKTKCIIWKGKPLKASQYKTARTELTKNGLPSIKNEAFFNNLNLKG